MAYCVHLNTNNENSKLSMNAMSNGCKRRHQELEEILKSVATDRYSCLLIGDMNDISGTSTLHTLENADFEEAW